MSRASDLRLARSERDQLQEREIDRRRSVQGDRRGDDEAFKERKAARQYLRPQRDGDICSTNFPKFSPRNNLSSVSGKVSRPTTTSSRDFSLPAAIQPANSRIASGYRSR